MATDTYWQLEKEYYTITTDNDLEIRVVEYENVTRTKVHEDGTTSEVTEFAASKVHHFKVKREILTEKSTYFKSLLYKEDGQPIDSDLITLHEDKPGSIEVWMKIFHGVDVHSTLTTIDLKGVWDVLATANRYQLDPTMQGAKAWFEAWYEANTKKKDDGKYFNFKDYQSLLFPCYSFDHAEGFQHATKYLAYRAQGHISERKPDGFTADVLRLDQNVMHQLNAAKGRLKTILHRNLYNPIDSLLKTAGCACKAEVLYAYEKALQNTGAWPLESAFLAYSVQDIIYKLNTFHTTYLPQMCHECGFNFKESVTRAVEDARKYFDGLCLDCMNASNPKLSTEDEDYWKHKNLGVAWDDGCRIAHKQPSWYFSFLGRKAKMMEWNKQKQQSGRNRNGRGFNRSINGNGNRTGGSVDAAAAATTAEGVAEGVAGVDLNE